MSNFYNPDYPTASMNMFGGFTQNNMYRTQPNETFFYGGPTNPFGDQSLVDSRRNIQMYGQQPGNVPMYGMNANQSCINPSTTPAFNALVESRRNNVGGAINNNNATTNPWAQQQASINPQIPNNINPVANNYQNNAFMSPYMNTQYSNMCCGGFDYVNPCGNISMYANPNLTFDKKSNYWDNVYTRPRSIVPPVVNWNAATNPQSQQSMYYSMPQYPVTHKTWQEITEENWSMSSL